MRYWEIFEARREAREFGLWLNRLDWDKADAGIKDHDYSDDSKGPLRYRLIVTPEFYAYLQEIMPKINRQGWHLTAMMKRGGGRLQVVFEPTLTPRVPKNAVFWHVTPRSNVESVMRDGLVPKHSRHGFSYPQPRVYLFRDAQHARRMVDTLGQRDEKKIEYALIRVDLHKAKNIRVHIDPEIKTVAVYVTQAVPVECLSVEQEKVQPLWETDEAPGIPSALAWLAREIKGRTWEAAKRIIAAKVGSVQPRERFADDIADAVFARLQRNSQTGQYDNEADLAHRNPQRLDGEGTIKLYRAAPRDGGIRPGDFATDSRHEAGFYRHGGNVIQTVVVPRRDVISVDGSTGGGREYVYLPLNHVPIEPQVHFPSFRAFFDAANGRRIDETDDRLARAQTMGFDIDEPIYHGTRAGEFPAFRINYRPKEQLGFGIHVTPDRSFAERYISDPLVARRGKTPHLFVGYMRKGKMLNADAIVEEGTPEFNLAIKLAGKRLMTQKNENGMRCAYMQAAIDSTSGKRAEQIIRDAGYDTIKYTAAIKGVTAYGYNNIQKAPSYVVLNPASLRRTNANFDKNKRDSDNLMD